MNEIITQSNINAPIEKVWEYWTSEQHIINWNFAGNDWYCPNASNDLRAGGEFHYTMSAKDHSFSFDFWGTYLKIEDKKTIEATLGDGRKLLVNFEAAQNGTMVTETFEPEQKNPVEMQRAGWQMILDRFKHYAEKTSIG